MFLNFIPCAPFFQLLHAFPIRLFTCCYDVSRVHVSTRNRAKVRTVHDFRYFPSIHGFVFLRYLFDPVPVITVTVNVFSISRYILINHHDARHRPFYSMIDTSILRESQLLWSLELRFVKVPRVAFVISFFGSFCAVICIVTCETRETSCVAGYLCTVEYWSPNRWTRSYSIARDFLTLQRSLNFYISALFFALPNKQDL